MRLVDANVFIHAILKPERVLSPQDVLLKDNANKLFLRINSGEKVGISLVQILEVIKIFENVKQHQTALRLQKFFLETPTIQKYMLKEDDLLQAHYLAGQYKENKISFNDLLAYIVMKRENIKKIYSFDKHFDIFPDITRLEK